MPRPGHQANSLTGGESDLLVDGELVASRGGFPSRLLGGG